MMNYKRYSKGMKLMSLVIAFVFMLGAAAIGAYASPVKEAQNNFSEQNNLLEQYYEEGQIASFSVLVNRMSDETLADWLARAAKDRDVSAQSVILRAEGKDKELEELFGED